MIFWATAIDKLSIASKLFKDELKDTAAEFLQALQLLTYLVWWRFWPSLGIHAVPFESLDATKSIIIMSMTNVAFCFIRRIILPNIIGFVKD